jgi:hypothetical protein
MHDVAKILFSVPDGLWYGMWDYVERETVVEVAAKLHGPAGDVWDTVTSAVEEAVGERSR